MTSTTKIEKLTQHNYTFWSKRMQALLQEAELWDIVQAPDDIKEKRAELNARASAKIALNVSDALLHHVDLGDKATAKDNWDALKRAYASTSEARRYQLRQQLALFKLQSKESITDYFARMAKLKEELANADCMVNDSEAQIYLLHGLPSSYSTVREILHGSGKSLQELEARLLVTEADLKSKSKQHMDGGMDGSSDGSAYTANGSKKKCTFCRKPGHTADDCRKKRAASKSNRPTCGWCGKLGHTEDVCYAKRDGKPKEEQAASSRPAVAYTALGAAKPATSCTAGSSAVSIIVDSGASHHMTPQRDLLSNFDAANSANPSAVIVASGQHLNVEGCGDIRLTSTADGRQQDVILKNALYVPSMDSSLLSVQAATAAGATVVFKHNRCNFLGSDGYRTLYALSKGKGELYHLQDAKPHTSTAFIASSKEAAELWHRRMGHLSYNGLAELTQQADGINVTASTFKNVADSQHKCDTCNVANLTRQPRPRSTQDKETELLKRLHVDTCGPMQVTSIGGARYYLLVIDEASRFSALITLESKAAAAEQLISTIKQWQNITGKKVGMAYLRSDKGTELVNSTVKTFLTEQGITLETTSGYSPESNGIAERGNRTIMEKVRAMLNASHLPSEFWAEAAVAANTLRNVSPSAHANKTPWELFYDSKPDISRLRTFGSLCYVHIPKDKRSKLDNRAAMGILLGTSLLRKTYRVWRDGKLTDERDVNANETVQGWTHLHPQQPEQQQQQLLEHQPTEDSSDSELAVDDLDTFSDDEEPPAEQQLEAATEPPAQQQPEAAQDAAQQPAHQQETAHGAAQPLAQQQPEGAQQETAEQPATAQLQPTLKTSQQRSTDTPGSS